MARFEESPTPCMYLATWSGTPPAPEYTFSCSLGKATVSAVTVPAKSTNSFHTLVERGAPSPVVLDEESISSSAPGSPGPFQVPSAQ